MDSSNIKNESFDRQGLRKKMGLAQLKFNPYVAVELEASQKQRPRIVRDAEKVQVRKKSRVNIWHVMILAFLFLGVGAQLVMMETALNGLHYEIEQTKYEVALLRGENDAHYQHLSELSQIDRLKEVLASVEGLELDNSRVYRLK